jgi:hypothetical protein
MHAENHHDVGLESSWKPAAPQAKSPHLHLDEDECGCLRTDDGECGCLEDVVAGQDTGRVISENRRQQIITGE